MDNQHRRIRGYRDLDENEIDTINEIKATGERLQALLVKVGDIISAQETTAPERHAVAEPRVWHGIARQHLQEGIMALTRAVAQPTSF